MTLYLLTTNLGDFYVLANDPTRAVTKLEELLDKKDYGFSLNRKVVNIRVITNVINEYIGDDERLVL